MKTIPPRDPAANVGPKYWRSLDQRADTPEVRDWVGREFPQGSSEMIDPVNRRHFVKIMSASFLLAGLGATGCRRPVENIYPFAKMPENYVHGAPQYFATSMPSRYGSVPLVVKSSDGRPTKVEGNPDLPGSNGGVDAFALASVLSLYDPDRAMRCALNGALQNRNAALDGLAALGKTLGDGTGLAILMGQSSSPSRARLQKELSEKFPKAGWFIHEPVDLSLGAQAASEALGRAVTPSYQLDKAKIIVSIDCDFIGTEENAHGNIQRFAKGRHLDGKESEMSRLYIVESLLTLTGINADHRLRVPPSAILPVLARLSNLINDGNLPGASTEHDAWLVACAKDLKANRGASLVLGGHRLPVEAQKVVLAINHAIGAIGETVEFYPAAAATGGTISQLAQALDQGAVQTLVILGGNPAYDAPADLHWNKAQAKAKTVVRLGYHEDETAWDASTHPATQWDLPQAHFLESWGDGRTAEGVLVPVQPLIDPLFGGLTELEVLAILGGLPKTKSYDIVRETFGGSEDAWRKFLHDGFQADSEVKPVQAAWNGSSSAQLPATSASAPTAQKLDVVFYRDMKLDDGRHNNNGWLQELPDPVTKLTWDNAVILSPATAKALGVFTVKLDQNQKFFDYIVEIKLGGATIKGPVWVQPGMADNTIGLALGYGRSKTGRVGQGTGFNAYALRTSAALHYASGAGIVNTHDRSYELATTQSHWSMEGRPAVREANLEQYREHPDFARAMDLESPKIDGAVQPAYPNPLDKAKLHGMHQWGMSIDLNRCVGCSACVVACQSENNIPIVGKEMVGKSREMHWIRIDRYFSAPPAKYGDQLPDLSDPQVVVQPMLCQHCEAAPCENVCPVNATSHDDEGLNVMTYNRCVGTRYCSNNCPYKVRRFNFFDYNRRPLNHLYKSPLVTTTDGEWELLRWLKNPDRGNLPDDQWQLSRLVKNPDVTVRMRGVMEKCSFCLQRIEQAKIGAKVRARDSGDIRLTEKAGTVPKTACQQACPAEAIVFGDTSDPESRVSQLKRQERDYTVLSFLLTKPRLTYLARVRNPNREMPDYKAHSVPYTTEEFNNSMGEVEAVEAPKGGS
jgi:molybdopterin-containing oxidoreductase family iron-sulfur binding subunit